MNKKSVYLSEDYMVLKLYFMCSICHIDKNRRLQFVVETWVNES